VKPCRRVGGILRREQGDCRGALEFTPFRLPVRLFARLAGRARGGGAGDGITGAAEFQGRVPIISVPRKLQTETRERLMRIGTHVVPDMQSSSGARIAFPSPTAWKWLNSK
jgi:hypothetical protein